MFFKQFGKAPSGKRLEKIKASSNYSNGAFKNLDPTPNLSAEFSFGKLLKSYLYPTATQLKPPIAVPHVITNLTDPTLNDCFIWLGHSSYFLRLQGINILVDPVLSGCAAPFSFMVKCFEGSNPYSPADFPEIDCLILTHDHYDHLDYSTIKQLQPKIKKIITGLGTGEHLEYWGYNPAIIHELDWYESVSIAEGIKLTATPARHFSGRMFKRNQVLFASFVLKTNNHNIFLGGDSGYGSHFKTIGEQFGPFDIAILECGQYNIMWREIHSLPDEMISIIEQLKVKKIIPVHYGKFKLALHDWNEPLKELHKNVAGKELLVQAPMIGQVLSLYEDAALPHWWKI